MLDGPEIIAAGVGVAAVFTLVSLFFLYWPWQWHDKRKLAKYLSEQGGRIAAMTGSCWMPWERVAEWTWIPVRRYSVLYTGEEGRRHRATASFYLPRWLNKMYDPGLEANFDFMEEDAPGTDESP